MNGVGHSKLVKVAELSNMDPRYVTSDTTYVRKRTGHLAPTILFL
jgi:hypothetical protein